MSLDWTCKCDCRLTLGAAPFRPASRVQELALGMGLLSAIWLVVKAEPTTRSTAAALGLAILVGLLGCIWIMNTFVPWVELARPGDA